MVSLSESRDEETRHRLRRTVLVVVACSAVPLVTTLILIAAIRAANQRRQRRHSLTQHHVTATATTKDLPVGHVVHSSGAGLNAPQQLPLGYVHQQVDDSASRSTSQCQVMTGRTVTSRGSAYMSTVPPGTGVVSASPCLSRHDRTSPWPVTPPAGRFGPASISPSGRYIQPQLMHYLVQQHQQLQQQAAAGSVTAGSAGSRQSTAAGSQGASSSPSSSSAFYHHQRAGPSHHLVISHHAKPPLPPGGAVRSTDWRCGLRPSGTVSFKTVLDADDSPSSSACTEEQRQHPHTSSYQPRYEPTSRTAAAANSYHNNRLVI